MRKIGYVCTTGSSLNNIEKINRLFELGMTTVRFNMSYREKCMINESREIPPEKEFINCPDHKVKEHFDGINDIFKSMFGVKNG